MSKKEWVFRQAQLVGEGREVPCRVKMTETTLSGLPPAYSDYSIMESAETNKLPNGTYALRIENGETIQVVREHGSFRAA